MFESVQRDLAYLWWVDSGWQLSPHPAARSLSPSGVGVRIGTAKVRKTHGLIKTV